MQYCYTILNKACAVFAEVMQKGEIVYEIIVDRIYKWVWTSERNFYN